VTGALVPRRRKPGEEARRVLLEQGAEDAGQRWAKLCRDDLRQEGRRAAGGWPGTIAEARARVVAHIGPELRQRGMIALTPGELEQVTRAAYASAKRDWLARGEREDPDPVDAAGAPDTPRGYAI
jgi:hypothetical protein